MRKLITKSNIFLSVSCIFLLLIAACVKNAEKQEIGAVVKAYNKALEGSYETMDFGPLKDLTTGREYNKVSIYIMSYAGQNERLNAHLIKFEIKKIDIKGNSADARTSEEWEYERVNMTTGEAVKPYTFYTYEMNYKLLKDDNKWKVDRLKIIKEDQKH